MKDGLVRADNLPLVFRASGAEGLQRGAHVRVRIGATDLLTLDVHANVIARLDEAALAQPEPEPDSEDADADSGTLKLAIVEPAAEGEPGDQRVPSSAPST